MLDFYQSDEFRQYRKKVVKAIHEYIRTHIETKEPSDFWKAQGAIGLARRVIDIPAASYPKEEHLKQRAKEDIESVFAGLIRGSLIE